MVGNWEHLPNGSELLTACIQVQIELLIEWFLGTHTIENAWWNTRFLTPCTPSPCMDLQPCPHHPFPLLPLLGCRKHPGRSHDSTMGPRSQQGSCWHWFFCKYIDLSGPSYFQLWLLQDPAAFRSTSASNADEKTEEGPSTPSFTIPYQRASLFPWLPHLGTSLHSRGDHPPVFWVPSLLNSSRWLPQPFSPDSCSPPGPSLPISNASGLSILSPKCLRPEGFPISELFWISAYWHRLYHHVSVRQVSEFGAFQVLDFLIKDAQPAPFQNSFILPWNDYPLIGLPYSFYLVSYFCVNFGGWYLTPLFSYLLVHCFNLRFGVCLHGVREPYLRHPVTIPCFRS